MPSIHFNGKTYNDLAEMPAKERQAYEQIQEILKDEDLDGTPDVFQGDVVQNFLDIATKNNFADPEELRKLEQLTPGQRAKISKGLFLLKKLGILPDAPEPSSWIQDSAAYDAEIRSSQPIVSSPSVIQEDTGPRWVILLTILIAAVILIAGVAALLVIGRGF